MGQDRVFYPNEITLEQDLGHFRNKISSKYSKICIICFSGCFPQRLEACKNFLGASGVPVAAFNCEGQCGLCDLCPAATTDVPECGTHCVAGKAACIDSCEKGKAICIGCGVV